MYSQCRFSGIMVWFSEMREVMSHLHNKFEQYNVDLQDRNKIYANVVFRLMLAASLRYDTNNISKLRSYRLSPNNKQPIFFSFWLVWGVVCH